MQLDRLNPKDGDHLGRGRQVFADRHRAGADVAGEGRHDDGVIHRFLRGCDTSVCLRDGGLGCRELGRELLVGAARNVPALHERGVAYARITFVEGDEVVDGPAVGQRTPGLVTPIVYEGERFFIYEERLAPGDTRERHSHSQRLEIRINQGPLLRQVIDGKDADRERVGLLMAGAA